MNSRNTVLFSFLSLIIFISGCSLNNDKLSSDSSAVFSGDFSDSDTDHTEEVGINNEPASEILSINLNQSCMNSSLNNKSLGTFCYIEETDTLFFTDSGKLYQKTGDELVYLMDSDAHSLHFVNGWLYYVNLDNYCGHIRVGDIYKYNPATGENIAIYYGNAERICAAQDKIYFLVDEQVNENTNQCYPYECGLDGEDAKQIENAFEVCAVDGDYIIMSEYTLKDDESKDYFLTLYNGTEKSIMYERDPLKHEWNVSICDNFVFSIREDFNDLSNMTNQFLVYNLETKELIESPLSDIGYMTDYTYINGDIYILTYTNIYKLSSSYTVSDTYWSTTPFDAIYTYGENIYGVFGDKMYLIEFNESNHFYQGIPLV